MKLIRKTFTEYYTAANGDHASITVRPDDSAALIVCSPVNNTLVFRQEYKTRRGALIAMHKKFGKCKFLHMTATFTKSC